MTLRELVAMAEARERSEWSRMSQLLALTANVHRDPKRTAPVRACDMNPFDRRDRDIVIERAPISVLRDVFIKKQMPRSVQESPA